MGDGGGGSIPDNELTDKTSLSNQFQGQLVRQDGGVAVGDVGKGARMDEHRRALGRGSQTEHRAVSQDSGITLFGYGFWRGVGAYLYIRKPNDQHQGLHNT